jgi:hypothetical protein
MAERAQEARDGISSREEHEIQGLHSFYSSPEQYVQSVLQELSYFSFSFFTTSPPTSQVFYFGPETPSKLVPSIQLSSNHPHFCQSIIWTQSIVHVQVCKGQTPAHNAAKETRLGRVEALNACVCMCFVPRMEKGVVTIDSSLKRNDRPYAASFS